MHGNGHLGRPALIRVRAQLIADHLLPPVHGAFDMAVLVVAKRVLPRRAPVLGNTLKVTLPLRGCSFGRAVGHGGRAWRDDKGRFRTVLCNIGGDAVLVLRAVGGERRHSSGDLIQQRIDLGHVIRVLRGTPFRVFVGASVSMDEQGSCCGWFGVVFGSGAV